jgi:hypothetical protein
MNGALGASGFAHLKRALIKPLHGVVRQLLALRTQPVG